MAPPKKKVAKKSTPSKKTAKSSMTKSKTKPKTKTSTKLTVKEALTKSQIIQYLTNVTELPRKDILAVFDALGDVFEAHLVKKGPGEFNFLGLFKCRVIQKPATKARSGTNPFTGEPMMFAAKPARSVIKIRPLKKMKEFVS
ncbi:MAG: HU family DNA-binding protein [Gammaproteobacteria bacterium]